MGSSTIQHEVKLLSAPAANQQWDYYAIFFSTMTIQNNGKVTYSS